MNIETILSAVSFNSHGLVMAIAQDHLTKEILMVAWMNRETLTETIRTNRMVYWSRSRKSRWLKGETSGHVQLVKSIRIDCDGDSLLFSVAQTDAACHENYRSCFFRELQNNEWVITETKVC